MQTKTPNVGRLPALLLSLVLTVTAFAGLSQKTEVFAASGNACYSLEGAIYGVYDTQAKASAATNSNRGNPVATLTTDANGNTDWSKDIDAGTYYVKELKASKGYALDTEVHSVKVEAGEETSLEVKEVPQTQTVGLLLKKLNKRGFETAVGDGVLQGAQYTVKYYDNTTGSTSGSPVKTWVLATDSKGEINMESVTRVSGDALYTMSGKTVWPLGTYSFQEKKAPDGFLKNNEVKIGTITSSGEGVYVTTFNMIDTSVNHEEDPIYGGLKISKVDADRNTAIPQGDASIQGAVFSIINRSAASVVVNDQEYAVGTEVMTITTNAQGTATTGTRDLQYGTYEIKEKAAPTGYKLNSSWSKTVQIRDDGVIVDATDPAAEDEVQRGGVSINKGDIETGKFVPMGSATFAGTTFDVINNSAQSVYVEGKWYNKGEVVKSIKIEKDGEPAKTGNILPYGHYQIKEVSADEKDSYLITDVEIREAFVKEDGKTIEAEPAFNQVKRGDFEFKKITDGTIFSMPNVAFVIKSDTTGEAHVVVTDDNGQVSTEAKWNKHTKNTNANDDVINADGTAKLGENGKIDDSNLNDGAGVWFFKDKEGNEAKKVNDSLCALPYDTYRITELPSEGNKGKQMLEDIKVVVKRDEVTVHGGTWTNDEKQPEYEMYKVRNEDAASNGNDKFGFQPGDFVTYDVFVANTNENGKLTLDVSDEFVEGAEYFTTPVVVDVKNATQNKLSKDKNTINITVEAGKTAVVTYGTTVKLNAKEYLADAAKDSDSLDKNGKDSNFVDQVNTPNESDGYRNIAYATKVKYKPDNGKEQELPDKEDPAQTPVKEPKIGTYLADDAARKIVSGDKVTLVDTIKYEGLTPGNTYVFEGTLMVKDTADPLVENGEKVTARSEEFVPTEPNGEAKVTFTVDVKSVEGKELVAFETAYKVKDVDGNKPKDEDGKEVPEIPVAEHKDPKDPAQTVEVPGYKMYKVRNEKATAKGNKFGFEKGQTVTYDVVIENISKTASITADVKDSFVEHPEYFTTPKVVDVKGATENSRSDDDNKVNITVKAGDTAVVTFVADIKDSAKEYLAAAAKDSDSLDKDGKDVNKKDQVNKTDDKDGYKNVAKVENPVPEDPTNPDNPDKPYNPLPPDEDESQTPVKEPEIGTYLADDAKKKDIGSSDITTLIDTVKYKGLTPGQKYAVIGTLMVKDSGDPLVENGEKVQAVGTFTAEKANGSTEVVFEVDTRGYIGKKLVAFEVAYNITGADLPENPTPKDVEGNGKKVGEHKEIDDPDQTVTIKTPEIGTYLADDANQKVIGESETTTLIDTVAYKNLTVGQEYAVVGELIVKETGNPLVESGKKIQAVGTFTAEKESGSTEVTFVVNTKGMSGLHLVAFETVYNITGLDLSENPSAAQVEKNGKKVAEHKNPSDDDQTVLIENPENPSNPGHPGRKVDTGDKNLLLGFGGSLTAALAGLLAMIRRKRAQTLK